MSWPCLRSSRCTCPASPGTPCPRHWGRPQNQQSRTQAQVFWIPGWNPISMCHQSSVEKNKWPWKLQLDPARAALEKSPSVEGGEGTARQRAGPLPALAMVLMGLCCSEHSLTVCSGGKQFFTTPHWRVLTVEFCFDSFGLVWFPRELPVRYERSLKLQSSP